MELLLRGGFNAMIGHLYDSHFSKAALLQTQPKLVYKLQASFIEAFFKNSKMDAPDRIRVSVQSTLNVIMAAAFCCPENISSIVTSSPFFEEQLGTEALQFFEDTRQQFLTADSDILPALPCLGKTAELYSFVRQKLGIRMRGRENLIGFEGGINTQETTIGEDVSLIYEVTTLLGV